MCAVSSLISTPKRCLLVSEYIYVLWSLPFSLYFYLSVLLDLSLPPSLSPSILSILLVPFSLSLCLSLSLSLCLLPRSFVLLSHIDSWYRTFLTTYNRLWQMTLVSLFFEWFNGEPFSVFSRMELICLYKELKVLRWETSQKTIEGNGTWLPVYKQNPWHIKRITHRKNTLQSSGIQMNPNTKETDI